MNMSIRILVVFAMSYFVSTSITRPVIGILSQPDSNRTDNRYSYIAASYVKWVEAGGGLPYGIPFDMSDEYHEETFQKINGILLPGGDQDLRQLDSKFMKTQKKYFDLSMEEEDSYIPIFGTCMGFQSLLILATNDGGVLESGFDSYNLSLPLDNLNKSSRIMNSLPSEIVDIFSDQPVTLNQHHDGIKYESFINDQRLMYFYDIVSTNLDRNGIEFVSTIEAKNKPIYGAQYHPEKVMFEINPDAIDASQDSTLANLALSAFFIEQSRKNNHRLHDLTELIFNRQPVMTDNYFLQKYYFPRSGKDEESWFSSKYASVGVVGLVVLSLIVFVCLSLCCICLYFSRRLLVKSEEEGESKIDDPEKMGDEKQEKKEEITENEKLLGGNK